MTRASTPVIVIVVASTIWLILTVVWRQSNNGSTLPHIAIFEVSLESYNYYSSTVQVSIRRTT